MTDTHIFDRIVCGLDGSPAASEAVRQARMLQRENGQIELVGIFEPPMVGYLPYAAPLHVEAVRREWERALFEAVTLCSDARVVRLPDGLPAQRLLQHVRQTAPTLVAVGASRHHRPLGAFRGDVATSLLHHSPVPVLVARQGIHLERFPRLVLVGYDGSPAAGPALDLGLEMAHLFGAELRVVAAGEEAELGCMDLENVTIERDGQRAVNALRDASREADLLIVGSRGLRGLGALGSVSERIGHEALCSVLVVKGDARPKEEVHDDARLVRGLARV